MRMTFLVSSFIAVMTSGSVAAAVRDPGIPLTNDVTQVVIDPAVGGRAISYTAGGRSWLWHDPAAIPIEATVDQPWLYTQIGGFHLWPAPQSRWKRGPMIGWPPPGWLDHGIYHVLSRDASAITLRSPVETHAEQTASGIQAELRYALVAPNSNRLTVTSTFTNTTTYPQFWSHWHITTVQLPANQQGCAVFPVRVGSAAGERGYLVQMGNTTDARYERDGALARGWWNATGGKFSADSDGGWLAAEDRATSTVFVQRFTVDLSGPFGTYPEGNCPLSVYFGDKDGFTELEVMGPERELAPAATTSMAVEWSACRVAGPLRTVTAGGVVVRPLTRTAGHITGSFGVHESGTAVLTIAGVQAWSGLCSPAAPLLIDVTADAPGAVKLVVGERPLAELLP